MDPLFAVALPSGFLAVGAEMRRLLPSDGGGDFSRGETGHWGAASPMAPVIERRGVADGVSVAEAAETGVNRGVVAAERARCIAAAEGCVEGVFVRGCGRKGDVLREVRGLAVADPGAEPEADSRPICFCCVCGSNEGGGERDGVVAAGLSPPPSPLPVVLGSLLLLLLSSMMTPCRRRREAHHRGERWRVCRRRRRARWRREGERGAPISHAPQPLVVLRLW